MSRRVDVAVIGAGPAGLAAARGLAAAGASVEVLEREREAGGTPRTCLHQGFGLRDLHRALSGPAYAARAADLAADAGAAITLGTQVTGWTDDGSLTLAGSLGPCALRARAVLLATGCRERPRPARQIAGSRPRGVFTTGMLQRVVAAGQVPVGHRAVIVGAEHVSYSALETLRHGGARTVAMTTEGPRSQTFAAVSVAARLLRSVPLYTQTTVAAIHGRGRVEDVELVNLGTGGREHVECDTVVLTAGWIPERELAELGAATLDEGTGGPRVDGAGRTDRPALFAAGNVLHGAEPADVAALEGRAVVGSILAYLGGDPWPDRATPIHVAPPLAWIVPNAMPGPPDGAFKLRGATEVRSARVDVEQRGRLLASCRVGRLSPGRGARLTAAWVDRVVDSDGDITITLAGPAHASRRARLSPSHRP